MNFDNKSEFWVINIFCEEILIILEFGDFTTKCIQGLFFITVFRQRINLVRVCVCVCVCVNE